MFGEKSLATTRLSLGANKMASVPVEAPHSSASISCLKGKVFAIGRSDGFGSFQILRVFIPGFGQLLKTVLIVLVKIHALPSGQYSTIYYIAITYTTVLSDLSKPVQTYPNRFSADFLLRRGRFHLGLATKVIYYLEDKCNTLSDITLSIL